MYYALCQMPLPPDTSDNILYSESDGRELDNRAKSFAESCYRAIKEMGYLGAFDDASILDIGCGIGYLLSILPGKHKLGIDPNPLAKKYARPGICVNCGTMESVDGLFDITMSWHVLEHVNDPPRFIKDMVEHTRIGGLIMIATPNADSIMAKSENWRCREIFHRYLIGRRLLRSMMIDYGLVVEKELTWGGFPAPRKAWQEIGNQVLKLFGHGDVQLVIARKS